MSEELEDAVLNETDENTEAQTAEETGEGIELTDTAEASETTEQTTAEEKEEDSKPQGRYVTDEELNEIVDKRVARKMSKKEKEYEERFADYQDIENVLNAGLGTSSIREATERVRESYTEQGIKLPERVAVRRSERENTLLAKAEASEIIEDGYEAMVDEANRLAEIGYKNLDAKDKTIFGILTDKIEEQRANHKLKELGASDELIKNDEFIKFKRKFATNTPIEEIYDLYNKTQVKPKTEKIGSMRNTSSGKKDFISEAEYDKMTREEVRANMDLIEKSMPKW